jgi:flavin reductase (DIM6/NTAB) family NADH-FMN oxidoreductase RutF
MGYSKKRATVAGKFVRDRTQGAGVFCVNVLREDQSHISESFAGRTDARGDTGPDHGAFSRLTRRGSPSPRPLTLMIALSHA